jgi:hypothetical protein
MENFTKRGVEFDELETGQFNPSIRVICEKDSGRYGCKAGRPYFCVIPQLVPIQLLSNDNLSAWTR